MYAVSKWEAIQIEHEEGGRVIRKYIMEVSYPFPAKRKKEVNSMRRQESIFLLKIHPPLEPSKN
jgi:hypothetical protein